MSDRLTLTTWNVNSVRLRIELLKMLTEASLQEGEPNRGPDVLCLQETKATDDVFPRDAVTALGYPHLLIKGMKGYNGVAIASRLPLTLLTGCRATPLSRSAVDQLVPFQNCAMPA